jgi:hypothetical protein
MANSSQTVGAIATALAKAQVELSNPEKNLTATITGRNGERTFHYASLATGLDLVRKCLGQHEIALMQTTAVEQGQIMLTSLLVHTSGEWIASLWPVCSAAEASFHMKGAALTYARRYALFALVGIAGEDDLDAPELTLQSEHRRREQLTPRRPSNGNVLAPRPLPLGPEQSAQLRERLLQEISTIANEDAMALWAHRSLPLKNTLTAEDAQAIDAAYLAKLLDYSEQQPAMAESPSTKEQGSKQGEAPPAAPVTPLTRTVRKRSKAHLAFVASQPCLICKECPCDAHHLKIAQPRSLGRKVSDEFTVPLCRKHHQELHRHSNEAAWWANMNILPLEIAKSLYEAGPLQTANHTDSQT